MPKNLKVCFYTKGTPDDVLSLRKSLAQSVRDEFDLEYVAGVEVIECDGTTEPKDLAKATPIIGSDITQYEDAVAKSGYERYVLHSYRTALSREKGEPYDTDFACFDHAFQRFTQETTQCNCVELRGIYCDDEEPICIGGLDKDICDAVWLIDVE